eukprot:COSAG06_NODE_3509_length_5256_cov_6.771379_2_plen_155_part_00
MRAKTHESRDRVRARPSRASCMAWRADARWARVESYVQAYAYLRYVGACPRREPCVSLLLSLVSCSPSSSAVAALLRSTAGAHGAAPAAPPGIYSVAAAPCSGTPELRHCLHALSRFPYLRSLTGLTIQRVSAWLSASATGEGPAARWANSAKR